MLSTNKGAAYRVAVITASDKGAKGERVDISGPAAQERMEQAGYCVVRYTLLPDEQNLLEQELRTICDHGIADLVLTTGGTGLSPRDVTPEATLAVAQRLVPGIPEAMRAFGMQITGRAMLSRGVAAIRKSTLILNLPGSPKAVRENLTFVLPQLEHALGILTGRDTECAQSDAPSITG